MQVQAGMTTKVVTITPDTTLADAREQMRRGRFRHLPVTDRGQLVGVVSERDVWPPPGLDPEPAAAFGARKVRSLLRGAVITVAPEDPLEEAARLLYQHRIGCLPVMRAGEMVGIITTTDIFHAFMRATGAFEPSSRVELRAGDVPLALTAIAEVARREHAPIVGLVLERAPNGDQRLVVRFATIQGPRVVAALAAAGLEVIAPAPEPDGAGT